MQKNFIILVLLMFRLQVFYVVMLISRIIDSRRFEASYSLYLPRMTLIRSAANQIAQW